jgi:uncharacterized protein (TIGR00266 family)
MKHEIKAKPDFASLTVHLDKGEQVVTEAGAMMGMSGGLTMETNMKGGLLGAAKRALGGESLFMNTYTADEDGQRIDIAPAAPGDIHHEELANNTLIVQSGAYLASGAGVEVDSKWGGAKTFFGGEGLFMLKVSGTGPIWFNSYGAIHEVNVSGSYTVDTGHIVGFEETLTFNVKKVGGLKSLFFSGEGLVCEFSGSGRLWIQTRNAPSLAGFLHPFRPVKQNN